MLVIKYVLCIFTKILTNTDFSIYYSIIIYNHIHCILRDIIN